MKEFLKRHHLNLLVVAGFILGVAVTLGALQFDFARRLLVPASGNGVFSSKPATASAAPSPIPVAAATPRAQPTPPPSATRVATAEDTVEAYMYKYTASTSSISFLNWSDYIESGDAAAITLHYRVVKQNGEIAEAIVRFTIQGGAITHTDLLHTGGQSSQPAATKPPVVIDHFTSALQAAMNGPEMTMAENNAYSLSQLEQAKQEAQQQHKPLGFLMVWGQFFGQPADTRGNDSVSALVHFYQVFHQNLVFVFVRHETELQMVPDAVKKGFFGMEEGGYAPNMAVTDATATDFITEIPYKHLDGAGRDEVFAVGARKIDQWLATHPNAMPTPTPSNQ
jgi:hypothetical protein